ncbi:hypothetical protein F5B20DRAFT_550112 [Whalleya microplaca]|nr:hypothetical protein F5B20DRAFT_550112 [Whalleya microplaca]
MSQYATVLVSLWCLSTCIDRYQMKCLLTKFILSIYLHYVVIKQFSVHTIHLLLHHIINCIFEGREQGEAKPSATEIATVTQH